MPEVTIKYKSSKTLAALKDLSKYFDFKISLPKKNVAGKSKEIVVNGVAMIQGSGLVNDAEMNEVFARSNFEAKDLRSKWQRRR